MARGSPVQGPADALLDLETRAGPSDHAALRVWLRLLADAYWFIFVPPVAHLAGYVAIGGNMVLRRSVLDRMHGFDTSIEFYGDDTDTARRASAFGRVLFSPRFSIETSGRRFLRQGLFYTTAKYGAVFIKTAFLGKKIEEPYVDVR
ncbi:MAG: hypothetical protein B7Z72_01425 [Gemmatimonadetes bacterium 21-71-4]|nr:MAG: hypothetical protein B7Z72_01425 [Gemmatimonadetes bacterium 21-71-4]